MTLQYCGFIYVEEDLQNILCIAEKCGADSESRLYWSNPYGGYYEANIEKKFVPIPTKELKDLAAIVQRTVAVSDGSSLTSGLIRIFYEGKEDLAKIVEVDEDEYELRLLGDDSVSWKIAVDSISSEDPMYEDLVNLI